MACDLAVGEHRLAHREADVLDLDLAGVDAVLLHERLPLREGAVGRGRAEGLAFEVLRLGDAGLGGGGDRERRLVVDHQHGLTTFLSGFWSWNLTSELMSKNPIG